MNTHRVSTRDEMSLFRTSSADLNDGRIYDRREFRVAIICALEVESTAVEAVFDKIFNASLYGKEPDDPNSYTLGRIGQHSVVLTYLSSMGKVGSATAAPGLRSSFTNVRFSLLVGVCGAIPFQGTVDSPVEVLLGDVIIGTEVVQYDYGRQYDDVEIVHRDSTYDRLGRLPSEIRAFLHKCKAMHTRQQMQRDVHEYIEQVCAKPHMSDYGRPSRDTDLLFSPRYIHCHHEHQDCARCLSNPISTCEAAREATCKVLLCDKRQAISRKRIEDSRENPSKLESRIHFGSIASGDVVIKSGSVRDGIARKHKVVAFEMEGAGIWDSLSPLVVKGVCDYADSHKHKGWQKYAAVVAASAAKALLSQWPSTTEGVPEQSPVLSPMSAPSSPRASRESHQFFQSYPSSLWAVPFNNSATLIGRSSEIGIIEDTLFAAKRSVRYAIGGLGGTGKSRLALEIAYRAKSRMSDAWIGWLQCSDAESFARDCRDLARRLNIPGSDDTAQLHDAKALLKQFLDQNEAAPWLLILDSADDETLWSARAASNNADAPINFLPRSRTGAILVTTRNDVVAYDLAQKNVIELQQLPPQDSKLMLEALLREPAILDDDTATTQLLDHLTHLPLAITQAAAFINQHREMNDIKQYLEIWNEGIEEEIIAILDEDFTDDNRYPDVKNAIAKTWLISFREIHDQHPVAITLLSYMSCLNYDSIPKSSIPALVVSRLDQLNAFKTLCAYAFIRAQESKGSDTIYDMHRLVHLTTRNYFRWQNKFAEASKLVAKHLCGLLPRDGLDTTVFWQRYLPHAERLVSTPEIEDDIVHHELQELLSTAYFEYGAYRQAEVHRQSLVKQLSEKPQQYAAQMVRNLSMLSSIFGQSAKWEKSLTAASAAVDMAELTLAPDDPEKISVKHRLADALRNSGRCEDALSLSLRTATEVDLCVFANNAAKIIAGIYSLQLMAEIHHDLGRYVEQEKNLSEASSLASGLQDAKWNLRKIEIDLDLSRAYCKTGKADMAVALLLPARRTLEHRLPRVHRLTMACVSHLADAYLERKQYQDAEFLYREQLELFKQIGRMFDSHVIRDRLYLAQAIIGQSQYGEAKELLFENVGMLYTSSNRDSAMSLDHIETLARMYWSLENQNLARGLMKDCYKRSLNTLGAERACTRRRLRCNSEWKKASQTSKPFNAVPDHKGA